MAKACIPKCIFLHPKPADLNFKRPKPADQIFSKSKPAFLTKHIYFYSCPIYFHNKHFIYHLLTGFESRAKPIFAWGKLKSLQTDFADRLKPADCFFKGGKRPQKNLG